MSERNYRGFREKGLEAAEFRGRELMDEAVTTLDFARRTAEYGHDYRDLLLEEASNETEEDAARFIGYELTEQARKEGIDSIETGLDEVEASVDVSENWLEKFYNSFDLLDRLQGGFIDDRLNDVDHEGLGEEDSMFGFNPSNPYRNQQRAVNNFTENDPEDIGELFAYDIFVLNDEWIAYKSGEKVPTVDPEVETYLTDLGVI